MRTIIPMSVYPQFGHLLATLNLDASNSCNIQDLSSIPCPESIKRARHYLTPIAQATLPRPLVLKTEELINSDYGKSFRQDLHLQRERAIEGIIGNLELPKIDLDMWINTHQLDSPAEIAFVRDVFYPIWGESGLARLTSQVPFFRSDGKSGRSDFVLQTVDGEIAIEIDGKTYHAENAEAVNKGRFNDLNIRDAQQQQQYLKVIRLTADHCLKDPQKGQTLLKERLRNSIQQFNQYQDLPLPEPLHPLLSAWTVYFCVGQQLGLSYIKHNPNAIYKLVNQHSWALVLGWIDALLCEFHSAALMNDASIWECLEFYLSSHKNSSAILLTSELRRLGFIKQKEHLQANHQSDNSIERWVLNLDHKHSILVNINVLDQDQPQNSTTVKILISDEPGSGLKYEGACDHWRLHLKWLKGLSDTHNWSYELNERLRSVNVALDMIERKVIELELARSRELLQPLDSEQPNETSTLFYFSRYFGHTKFREGQWEIISRLLQGQSTLGVLPTGAGKSVCFQLPALLLGQSSLVVSPLISLIQDQVTHLRALSIPGVLYVSGSQTEEEKQKVMALLRNGACTHLYVSPERLQMKSFIEELRYMIKSEQLKFSLAVLDEAHIASEWGHGFRPSYLSTPRRFKELASDRPIALLTATASAPLRKDLLRLFTLSSESEIRPKSFVRDELSFKVIQSKTDGERFSHIKSLLREQLPAILSNELGESPPNSETLWESITYLHKYSEQEPRSLFKQGGIIFTPYATESKKNSKVQDKSLRVYNLQRFLRCEVLNEQLELNPKQVNQKLKDDIHCAFTAYTSKVDQNNQDRQSQQKHHDQDHFMNNRSAIMIATKGFGMGIDKPNLRYVIHPTLAGSIEGYYQEVGRSGRDREAAVGVLLHAPRVKQCAQSHPRGAPPCVDQKPKIGQPHCPYGLDEKCGYGIQAFMMYDDAKPVLEVQKEVFELFDKLWGHAKNQLINGGQFKSPVDMIREGLKQEPLLKSLNYLQQLGVVKNYNINRQNSDQLFVNLFPISLEKLLNKLNQKWPQYREYWKQANDLGLLIENALRLGLNLSMAEAEQAASLWQSSLSVRRHTGDTIRLDLYKGELSRKKERDNIKLEQLLYRLSKIAIVSDYLISYEFNRAEWLISTYEFEQERLWIALKDHLEALIPLRGQELQARLTRQLDQAQTEAESRANELAKHMDAHEALVKSCIMSALRQMLIISDEVLVTQRWQMLTNHERYAQEQGCRTSFMLNMLGTDDRLSASCDRCDNCGIKPLKEVRAEKFAKNQALVDEKKRREEDLRKQRESDWLKQVDRYLQVGFGEGEMVDSNHLQLLVAHIEQAPFDEGILLNEPKYPWTVFEARLRGVLEASPDDLFLNASLSIALMRVQDSEVELSTQVDTLLKLIEKAYSGLKQREAVLRALPLDLLKLCFERHNKLLDSLLEPITKLCLAADLYGAMSQSNQYTELECSAYLEQASKALTLSLSFTVNPGESK